MRYLPFKQLVAAMALSAGIGCVAALWQTSPYGSVGSPPTKEDLGNVAWTAGPSGKDLPSGSGTAKQGTQIYLVKCSMCHGRDGEGVRWAPMALSPLYGPRLAGGNGVPTYNRPPGRVTTMAYTVPWATAIFDTIAVEMPFFRAGTLTPDEVYSLTAFVLFKNNLIKEDEVMDRETLPKVQMPNRNAYPASDEVYMDMKKRGCYEKYGICRD